jgi:crotonobetainyl-CoA:carnitine CoA-transferase CaiB-like acyl-CoA transferase
MFDVVTDLMSYALHQARSTGNNPPRVGVGSPIVAPYGAHETSDGHVIVFGTTNDAEWRRMATVMLERPDLAEEPKYAANIDRCRYRDELDAVIAEWTASKTFADAAAAADKATIGWARLNAPSDVVDHPQLRERGRWVTTQGPGGGFESLRPPADAAGWTWSPGAVPAVGEHTADVLAELGLDA